jgi:hypothetical protein
MRLIILIIILTLTFSIVHTQENVKKILRKNKAACDSCISNGPLLKYVTENIISKAPSFVVSIMQKIIAYFCIQISNSSEKECSGLVNIYQVYVFI